MAGIISSELQEYIHQVLHESLFILPSGAGQIAARWGTIPAHDTYDPYEIEAIDKRSWLLDLDIPLFYHSRKHKMNKNSIVMRS
jgi:hypothetical protein